MQFQQTLWRLDIIPLSGNLKPPLWMPKSNCRRKSQSGKDLIISRSIGLRHKHNSRVLFIIQTSYIDDLILDTVITGSQLHPPISSPQRYVLGQSRLQQRITGFVGIFIGLRLFGLNTDNRIDRRIIARAGIVHHFHALDVVGSKLVEFGFIPYFTSVDVNFRSPGTKYFNIPLIGRYAGYLV